MRLFANQSRSSLLAARMGEDAQMKRSFKTFVTVIVTASALTLALVLPASTGAKTGAVKWICDVPDEGEVTFVSAPAAAEHGIRQANDTAGVVFHDQFGEDCSVVLDP
jgi:hypothetical protein